MRYEEFTLRVKDEIKNYLPEELQNGEIVLETTAKNNGIKRTGFSVHRPGETICPRLYLEESYADFQRGVEIETIFQKIAENYCSAIPGKNLIGSTDFLEFDGVKDHIVFTVINREKNKEELLKLPHIVMEDLAVIYRVLIELPKEEEGVGMMKITNEFMERWGVKAEELHTHALENTPRLLPAELSLMSDVEREIEEEIPSKNLLIDDHACEPEEMYMLTNNMRVNGATAILYPGLMEQVQEIIGESYYILPSSIHELVLMRKDEAVSKSELGRMVRSTNCTQLEPDEFLSDRAYEYDKEQKTIRQVKESLPNREVQER